MIKYFQLTPEILLEYVYENEPKLSDDGIKGNEKDIYNESPTLLLSSKAFGSKYLCFKNESEGLDSFSNLVLPLNNTETQFVVAKSKYQNFFSKSNASNMFMTNRGGEYMYENTNYDKNIISNGESCDVKYDKCIVHFTSRNYFSNYDALIFQAYAYLKNKSKIYFASFIFRRKSNLHLKAEHMLYNEKLYTTHIEFDIPSAFAIFNNENKDFGNVLKSQNIELLENTPIGINVYGVNSTIKGTDNYERLKTSKLSSVSIPYIYNRFDEININISEALDGDYYIIDPEIGSKNLTFVDYIESMGENIRAYVVMHELYLREIWVDDDEIDHSEITHKECHIVDIGEYDEDEEINNKFDASIKYRPICTQSGNGYKATIIDTLKIINTIDSSSYEVTGSLDIDNPYKYGKKLKRLGISNENRPIINVYNKKTSSENGANGFDGDIESLINGGIYKSSHKGISLGTLFGPNRGSSSSLSTGSGFVIENMTQEITSFIECTNVGVKVVDLNRDDIEN